MLSHANLWLGAESVASYLKLAADDRVLGVLPLSFDYGQNQLLSSWYAGAAVAPIAYLTDRDVGKEVARLGITTRAGVQAHWEQGKDGGRGRRESVGGGHGGCRDYKTKKQKQQLR